MPAENEWYKAALYSPVKGGVGSPGDRAYSTQSDTAPGNVIGSGANQAKSFTGAGFSVTQQSTGPLSSQNYLTDVGAFTNSASFYGTFDQSGNVYQWNDLDGTAGSSRGLRGGGWYDTNAVLSSAGQVTFNPSSEQNAVGFRLAAVPEPSTCVMALAGLACGGYAMFRRRKRA